MWNELEGHGPGKLLAPLALRSARKGAGDLVGAVKRAVEVGGDEERLRAVCRAPGLPRPLVNADVARRRARLLVPEPRDSPWPRR
jgi:hypothetical protein